MPMRKELTELPSDVLAQIRSLEALPDDRIDTTDAPEILDWSDAQRGVFYRDSTDDLASPRGPYASG